MNARTARQEPVMDTLQEACDCPPDQAPMGLARARHAPAVHKVVGGLQSAPVHEYDTPLLTWPADRPARRDDSGSSRTPPGPARCTVRPRQSDKAMTRPPT
jgi:hypothetical protein